MLTCDFQVRWATGRTTCPQRCLPNLTPWLLLWNLKDCAWRTVKLSLCVCDLSLEVSAKSDTMAATPEPQGLRLENNQVFPVCLWPVASDVSQVWHHGCYSGTSRTALGERSNLPCVSVTCRQWCQPSLTAMVSALKPLGLRLETRHSSNWFFKISMFKNGVLVELLILNTVV